MKAAMVSNRTLAAFCVHLELHRHIQHAQGQLANAIHVYSTRMRESRRAEYRLAAAEQRLPGQYWLEDDAPKVMYGHEFDTFLLIASQILSDVIEAIVGALFVSEGYSIDTVEACFNRLFKPFYDKHISLHTLTTHPRTTFTELLQAEQCHQHHLEKFVESSEVRYEGGHKCNDETYSTLNDFLQ